MNQTESRNEKNDPSSDQDIFMAVSVDKSGPYQPAKEKSRSGNDGGDGREWTGGVLLIGCAVVFVVFLLIAIPLGFMLYMGMISYTTAFQGRVTTQGPQPHVGDLASMPIPVEPWIQIDFEALPVDEWEKNIDVRDPEKEASMKDFMKQIPRRSAHLKLQGCGSWTLECAMNKEGTRLLTGTNQGEPAARVFDIESGKVLARLAHEKELRDVEFHPAKPYLCTLEGTPELHLWDAESFEKIKDIRPFDNDDEGRFPIAFETEGLYQIAFDSEGVNCLIGTKSGRVFQLDIESEKIVREYASPHSGEVRGIRFHPNGKFFATIGVDSNLKIWDLGNEEPIRIIPNAAKGELNSVRFSPDGSKIITSARWNNKYANLYNFEDGELFANYGGYGEDIRSVNFSPDGHFIVTGDNNYKAVIWNGATKTPLWIGGNNQGNHTYDVFFTPDQRKLVVVSGYNPTIYRLPPEIINPPVKEKNDGDITGFSSDYGFDCRADFYSRQIEHARKGS